MTELSLALLGPPVVQRDGAAVTFDTRKAIALLALLAVTGREHSREQLADLLWPEADSAKGRASLRRTLSVTAAVMGDGLTISRAAVALQPTQGTVITIPHGTVCGTPWIPNDTQILALSNDSSHVNTTTGVFTAITIPSGFPLANGQKVIFTGAAGCLPGSLSSGNDGNSYYNNGPSACQTQ